MVASGNPRSGERGYGKVVTQVIHTLASVATARCRCTARLFAWVAWRCHRDGSFGWTLYWNGFFMTPGFLMRDCKTHYERLFGCVIGTVSERFRTDRWQSVGFGFWAAIRSLLLPRERVADDRSSVVRRIGRFGKALFVWMILSKIASGSWRFGCTLVGRRNRDANRACGERPVQRCGGSGDRPRR